VTLPIGNSMEPLHGDESHQPLKPFLAVAVASVVATAGGTFIGGLATSAATSMRRQKND
jgi:hypothetical protein